MDHRGGILREAEGIQNWEGVVTIVKLSCIILNWNFQSLMAATLGCGSRNVLGISISVVLESYIDEFEHLRSLVLQHNHFLPDSYFLESFIGGLKSTVKPFVRAYKPQTVTAAIEYARCQEESIEVSNGFYKASTTAKSIFLRLPLNQTHPNSHYPHHKTA